MQRMQDINLKVQPNNLILELNQLDWTTRTIIFVQYHALSRLFKLQESLCCVCVCVQVLLNVISNI